MTSTTSSESPINLVSIRIITEDVAGLSAFYERVTGVAADHPTPAFAEIVTPAGTLAIGATATVALFGRGSAEPAANRSAILEFIVADVDAEYERLLRIEDYPIEFVTEPTTMPWGNRSLLFRDPDGHLVNFFTPVNTEAIAKFTRVASRR